MAFFRAYKKLKIRIVNVLVLAITIFLLMVMAGYPYMVEKYYSQGFYRYLCMVLHPIFNLFPFSIGDLVYVFAVITSIFTFFKLFKQLFKKQFEKCVYTFLSLIIAVEAGIVIFYVFWGMNYYRPSAAERLNLADSTYSIEKLKAITVMLIDSTNATRHVLIAADFKQNNDTIYQAAINATKLYAKTSSYYYTHSPGVKSSLLTPLINYLGTSGYYNPFTSEAQINFRMPVHIRPFVACHELAHQNGFGPEDEASFAGFLAGIHAKDKLLKYSAYYDAMTEFMYALRSADSTTYKAYKKRISKKVMHDLKTENTYWEYYEGRLEIVSSIFYDNFLKANNQPQGLLTYNQMVALVMAWYNQNYSYNTTGIKRL